MEEVKLNLLEQLLEAGYDGFSMSNRARYAYESGEEPKSKWTKQDILDEVEEYHEEENLNFDTNLLKKIPLTLLRDLALDYSSWHHTSSHYNETDFYSIDTNWLDKLTDEKIEKYLDEYKIDREKEKEEKARKEAEGPVMRECEYLVWGGTRKHPKAEEHRAKCEIKGNWAITPHGRKSIHANGFMFLD